MRAELRAIIDSYAGIFFLPGARMGVCLLAVTMVNPGVGLAGVVAVLSAYGVACLAGMGAQMATQGFHIYNPLLVGLSAGYLFGFSATGMFTAAIAGGLTFTVTACMADIFLKSFRLPVLSLPFVLVSTVVYLASLRYYNLVVLPQAVPAFPAGDAGLPYWAAGFFRAIGAVLFSPVVPAGIFVSILIIVHSRILFLLAVTGYAAGIATRAVMFGSTVQACCDINNFNFILIAMALGGIFMVPSLTAYLLAVLAVVFSAVVMDAATAFLAFCGAPVLTFPFNAVCLGMVYMLGLARHKSLALQAGATPEETLEMALANRWRYTGAEATLYLPFAGQWTVWQGFDGEWTHKGIWRHAYDFVITDERGATFSGDGGQLEDYYCFRKPVLAPVKGRVVRVVDNIPDSVIGNPGDANEWGNHVVIQDPRGFYVELSHFAEKGIQVSCGDWVERGAVLGVCGNSGYSPQPHIHVQVQVCDAPGAATLPFSFVSYQEGSTFHSNHLPGVKSRVEALYPQKRLDQAMSFALDDKLEYRILCRGVEQARLKLAVRMAPDGCFYFESERGALFFGRHEGTFYFYRVTGRDPWLRLMFLAMPRLPLSARDGVSWSDYVPANLASGRLLNGLIGFLSSFYPELARVRVDLKFEAEDRVVAVITSRFSSNRREIGVVINHGKGIRQVSVSDVQLVRV